MAVRRASPLVLVLLSAGCAGNDVDAPAETDAGDPAENDANADHDAPGEPDGIAPSGWDYDLTRRCATTTGQPGDINYHEDTQECATASHWTVAVESEVAPAQSCPGPTNRSFAINEEGGPITLDWIAHQSDLGPNWTVNMKVDHVASPNPCGDQFFTYFGMMDHVDLAGGPLPEPLALISSHELSYDEFRPTPEGATRLLFGATFYWGGRAHWLEVTPTRSDNWGDAHPDPGVIIASREWGTPDIEFVMLDGAAWGIDFSPGSTGVVSIDWKGLVAEMIDRGLFDPIGELPSVTQSVYIGVEVRGRAVANLYHTSFRTAASR